MIYIYSQMHFVCVAVRRWGLRLPRTLPNPQVGLVQPPLIETLDSKALRIDSYFCRIADHRGWSQLRVHEDLMYLQSPHICIEWDVPRRCTWSWILDSISSVVI